MTEVHGWERPKYFAPAGFAEKAPVPPDQYL